MLLSQMHPFLLSTGSHLFRSEDCFSRQKSKQLGVEVKKNQILAHGMQL